MRAAFALIEQRFSARSERHFLRLQIRRDVLHVSTSRFPDSRQVRGTISRPWRRRREIRLAGRNFYWQELLPTGREEARKAGPGSRLMRTFWGKLSLFNCHLSFADGNRRLLLEEPLAIMQFVRHGGHYFAHLAAGDQLECVLRLPGMGISDGVFKSEINLQRPGIDTPNPFDDTKFLTVGMTDAIQPRRILESDRVYDQRVAFPLADGLAIP